MIIKTERIFYVVDEEAEKEYIHLTEEIGIKANPPQEQVYVTPITFDMAMVSSIMEEELLLEDGKKLIIPVILINGHLIKINAKYERIYELFEQAKSERSISILDEKLV